MIYDDAVDCADADDLAALLADALPEAERVRIVDHAASCERCREVVFMMVDRSSVPATMDTASGPRAPIIDPGARVGRYVLEDRLGAGGMGVVYAAMDSELLRRVAIKLLRPGRSGELDTQRRERLLREARTLAQLSHPNVVTVFDVGVHGEHLFVAMELVDGGSLVGWLRREPRTWRDIVDRMIETAKGLAAAHAAGVVHRDIKPDNILVGDDGRARLTDFGLARIDRSDRSSLASVLPDVPLTMTHAFIGTPLYMAPEQLDGATADERSDQWAFCATLYEAVAGARPFAATDVDARKAEIAEGRLVEPVRRVPAWLRKIIETGLRANPAERWPSMMAIVDALVRGRARRRRMIVAGVAVAAVAAAVTAVAIARRPAQITIERHAYEIRDERRGCDCPYAACTEHGCVGECNAAGYRRAEPVPGVSREGLQEALLGATPDGDTILYAASSSHCAIDRLMLARRRGPVFVPVDLTDSLRAKLPGVTISEGNLTLASDARSLIVRAPGNKHFVRARLDGDHVTEIDAAELAGLHPPLAPNQSVRFPVLSPDELSLFYLLEEVIDGDQGPLHGTYVSTREHPRMPFSRGTRLGGRARSMQYPTAISSDGLALFMTNDFTTRVLFRANQREPFAAGEGMAVPPTLYGWRAIPIENCGRILTTATPGGCHAEDIVYLEPIPR